MAEYVSLYNTPIACILGIFPIPYERMIDLSRLNEQQQKAVTTVSGPVLVLAGPGSGKTAVLVYRIAYLIDQGVKPEHILAVTFTNKAAKEMKERIQAMVESSGLALSGLTMGTFHRVCALLLRHHAGLLGYLPSFVIYDRQDQLTLLKRLWSMLGVNNASLTPGYVLDRISRAKSELASPQEYRSRAQNEWEGLIATLYEHYQEELHKANAFDFDDLIMKTVELFEEHPSILAMYQQKFQYILVDEFQDTNVAQARLVKLLASAHRNICVVGDDAQGIYSFRSADFRNILMFEKEYPDARVIKLEQNYRSTQIIVQAASKLIAYNEWRVPKELWTENPSGTPIAIVETANEKSEAEFVVAMIRQLGLPLEEYAIFFRTNTQSRPIEEALIREGVSYRTVGLIRFYERKEVKDIIAYLRILENPGDTVSMQRIINVPKRGLTKESFKRIAPYQRSLLESGQIPEELKEKLTKNAVLQLGKFLALYQEFEEALVTMSLAEFVGFLLDQTEYRKVVKKSDNVEERESVLEELISLALEYKDKAKDQLSAFLERTALFSAEDSEQGEGVSLMTVHAAKGLEFPVVFITGLEYGVFPHYKSLLNPSDLEEERRLAYVAITRAKEQVFLTYARMRRIYGRAQANPPSNFLEEIPEELTIRQEWEAE